MLPESKALASAVTVWGNRSLFTHTMRSPRCTVSCAGLNCRFSMTTVCTTAAAGLSEPAVAAPVTVSAASSGSAARLLRTRTAQLGLQCLGVLEVCLECRSYLHQQRLELRILRARD